MIKIYEYSNLNNEEIFDRNNPTGDVSDIVSEIIDDVRKNGDAALFKYCEKFDKAKLTALEVSAEEIEEAFSAVDPQFIEILEKAAKNIREFHSAQKRNSFVVDTDKTGVVIGQKVIPIEKAGLYVPGGTAAYPSTVLILLKLQAAKKYVYVHLPRQTEKSILLFLLPLKLQELTVFSK